MEQPMSVQVEKLSREAMLLSPERRLRLVENLLQSLEGRA
jgi:hypothetical protein